MAFAADFARFRITDNVAQVELYLAVPRAQLRFVPEGEALLASFESRVAISLGDSQVINHHWVAHSPARDTSEIKPIQLLYTQANFQLPAASYRFWVRVRDLNSNLAGQRVFQMEVDPFDSQRLTLSDLEISSRAMRDTAWSPFYKNHYTVIPNPGATFGAALPMLYVYAEIYNLTHPSDSTYSVLYRIFDGEGTQVKALPAKRRKIAGRQLVEVGAFNVISFPGGTYHLEVRVTDHATQQEAFRRHKFYVYREDEQPSTATGMREIGYELLSGYYRNRGEKELDEEFKTLRYISAEEERKIYASLDVSGKRDFLIKFWQGRDRSPETPRNEFRENYLVNVKYANEHFSGLREGYLTDMGRVLLTFGQADEIENHPSSSGSRAHQIWKYFEIEGGVEFVFVDINNWGDYRLVHSSARGELADANWQRWIDPSR